MKQWVRKFSKRILERPYNLPRPGGGPLNQDTSRLGLLRKPRPLRRLYLWWRSSQVMPPQSANLKIDELAFYRQHWQTWLIEYGGLNQLDQKGSYVELSKEGFIDRLRKAGH